MIPLCGECRISGILLNEIYYFSLYSLTPPIVRPVTKYLCRNGYRHTIGSMVAIVAAARIDAGVMEFAEFLALSALPLCCMTEDKSFINSYCKVVYLSDIRL